MRLWIGCQRHLQCEQIEWADDRAQHKHKLKFGRAASPGRSVEKRLALRHRPVFAPHDAVCRRYGNNGSADRADVKTGEGRKLRLNISQRRELTELRPACVEVLQIVDAYDGSRAICVGDRKTSGITGRCVFLPQVEGQREWIACAYVSWLRGRWCRWRRCGRWRMKRDGWPVDYSYWKPDQLRFRLRRSFYLRQWTRSCRIHHYPAAADWSGDDRRPGDDWRSEYNRRPDGTAHPPHLELGRQRQRGSAGLKIVVGDKHLCADDRPEGQIQVPARVGCNRCRIGALLGLPRLRIICSRGQGHGQPGQRNFLKLHRWVRCPVGSHIRRLDLGERERDRRRVIRIVVDIDLLSACGEGEGRVNIRSQLIARKIPAELRVEPVMEDVIRPRRFQGKTLLRIEIGR